MATRRRPAPCAVGRGSVARRSRAAAGLVLRDRLLQVAVFRAREPARLVERGQALLGAGEVARLQVELPRVFERAAVLRVDAQRFVVELLGSREIGRRAFAQAVAHQVVPVGIAGVVQALELVDRAGKFLAAICARTPSSLSGDLSGSERAPAAKALVANSSAPVIRMRVMMVFMIGSVVGFG